MQIIKSILKNVGTGLAYGVGICIVFVAAMWGAGQYQSSKYKSDDVHAYDSKSTTCNSYKKCKEDAGLSVEVTSEKISSEEFILLGKVSNSSDIKWSTVKLKAELFDADGNFIDECTEYVDDSVEPKKSINFKISCAQCSKVNLENYHTYSVRITDATTY